MKTYTDFILEKTCGLLNIGSPTGYTENAIAWLRQEFAALCNANENPGDDDPDDDAVYIMQVNTFEDENGEEMEEFVPPEEALMEKLIQVVRTRFSDEVDDEDEDE